MIQEVIPIEEQDKELGDLLIWYCEAYNNGDVEGYEVEKKKIRDRIRKMSRNSPCYCGSGLKLKKCCGKLL